LTWGRNAINPARKSASGSLCAQAQKSTFLRALVIGENFSNFTFNAERNTVFGQLAGKFSKVGATPPSGMS
jgi:hypothetical protein